MQIRKSALFVCACAVLGVVSSSNSFGQLVVGTTTTTTTNAAATYIDVTTGQQTTMWNSATNKKVNGVAADLTHGVLYANDSARLNFWNMNPGALPAAAPTFIAGLYRTNDHVTFSATGVDGLTWANGNLYGVTSFASSTFKRGIYQIATTSDGMATPHCVMSPTWVDASAGGGSDSLGDVAYRAASNDFLVLSNADTTGIGGVFGLGVYSVDAFGAGTVAKVANFPAGRTHVDGITVGGGLWYMSEQEPGANRIDIYPYDPTTATYGTTIFVPLTDATQRASGITWAPGAIPEPSTLGVLAIAGLAAMRRRRA